MSEFLPGVGPVFQHQTEVTIPAQVDAGVPAKPLPDLTPEQLKAIDAAMAQAQAQDQESQTVIGLLGMWAGSMLLKDLAEEHFHVPADDPAEAARKNKPSLPKKNADE